MQILKYKFDLRTILFLIAIIYIIVYFAITSTPGNQPETHPLGWWGWFDQGKYLLSANAFIQLDFSPEKHFYPPLYPILGAIFLKWSSGHLFFLINLSALMWFSYVFIKFSDLYIPRWGSILLLFGTTIFNGTLFLNYVIPWTTNLSVALLASGIIGLVWLAEVRNGERDRLTGLQIFFVATCLGLLVPTRPVDAIVGCVIGIGLVMGYWSARKKSIAYVPRIRYFLIIALIGMIIGPSIFIGFNILIFSSSFGSYMQMAGSNGFFPADLVEKFISIWLDGLTLYGEHKSGLTERYPWLFVSMAGILWALVRGDGPLRSVAVAIVFLFVLYLPYGDLLPNGLWRYLNIHYFKWTFPFLALFAVLLIKHAWTAWKGRRDRFLTFTLLLGIPFLLLSLHLVLDVVPVSTRTTNNQGNISFELPNKKIDFVDLKGITGGFTDIYLGSHRLMIDGKDIKRIRDYRLLPMSWGVRLLFIRPLSGQSMEFIPDQKLTWRHESLSAQIGNYSFSLGALKPFRKIIQLQIFSDYRLGEVIDFSQQGRGSMYATQGWSGPEAWGRWSVNNEAAIQLRLADPFSNDLKLTLVMGGFVSEPHPCQEAGLIINEKKIAQQSLCVSKGGGQPSPYQFFLPRESIQADGKINIRLVTPDSISPKKLGISTDDRVLGVGIKSLLIEISKD